MMIYPTLQILNGACVVLEQGCLDDPVIWHSDPMACVRDYAATGAEWIHLTDLNAVQEDYSQIALMQDLMRAAQVPVQLAGGLRTRKQVEEWVDRGVGRVVVSTLAARDPRQIMELAQNFPDQIVVSVDVWQGKVMTEGWRSADAWQPHALMRAYDPLPLAGFIVTDIDNELSVVEEPLGLISGLARSVRTPVIASGVVRTLDDIARLKYVSNIAGSLLGTGLLQQHFDLAHALSCAQPDPEPTAAYI
ncbi:HisA/HisF-related TIM barrel protein [Sulfitobacter pontiacus]|uniref:HisA/HisF-related TIM barrel protein n=1 Tax=Sulfitobacter pontiacus TaxID=60137 RepID=UPI0032976C45